MKPSRIQYVLAENLPAKACRWLLAALLVGLVIKICQPSRPLFDDGLYLSLFLICLSLAPVLGFFLSLPLAWIVGEPLDQYVTRLNGAPFQPGDRIRILVGPHRDCVVRVYDVWDSRSLVRVELGRSSGRTAEDIYSFTQICRERDR
jgi:hypothetical protein